MFDSAKHASGKVKLSKRDMIMGHLRIMVTTPSCIAITAHVSFAVIVDASHVAGMCYDHGTGLYHKHGIYT